MERVTLNKGDKRELEYEFAGMLDKVEYYNSTNTLTATDEFTHHGDTKWNQVQFISLRASLTHRRVNFCKQITIVLSS